MKLIPYKIPFKNQFREGLIVHIKTQEGEEGFGEIAPLPNWSKETLNDAKKQALETLKTPHSFEELQKLDLYPSVRFGLESALLDIEKPLDKLPPLPLCALLPRPAAGFKMAKLKVGHLRVKEAVEAARKIPKTLKLRIDVNRKWSLDDVKAFCNSFPHDFFDYIEEPLSNFDDYQKLTSLHPIAFDETFRERPLRDLLAIPNLKALVAKPTLQGGLTTYLPLMGEIQKKGIDFIISSSYESEVGIYALAKMAFRLRAIKKPLGLDTLHFFSHGKVKPWSAPFERLPGFLFLHHQREKMAPT